MINIFDSTTLGCLFRPLVMSLLRTLTRSSNSCVVKSKTNRNSLTRQYDPGRVFYFTPSATKTHQFAAAFIVDEELML